VASRWSTVLIAVVASAATAASFMGVHLLLHTGEPSAARPIPPEAIPPIDAARIASGRLTMERIPSEVGSALERHSDEIVKTAEVLETKQARINGKCAPGSAIRVIAADGSVSCQQFPKGVASVSALAAFPRLSTTVTASGSVRGGIGRFQLAGDDDYLVVPITLPDGAVVTSFSYVFLDASDAVDGAAYLYRSDDLPMAMIETEGASDQVRMLSSDHVEHRKIDASRYAYFVYFGVSSRAQSGLIPISASVTYRVP
jgi:hypothetical protein